MWKLANVMSDLNKRVNVVVYSSTGAQTQTTESALRKDDERRIEVQTIYERTIANFLKEGWEPFNIPSYNTIWFRMKVEE